MEIQNIDEWNKENQIQEEIYQEERRPEERFNDFMFGPRKGHHQKIEQQQQEVNHNQNYIDYEQLMYHIDTFMESTKNLKPLFQKFQPFVEQFWKKK